MKLHRNHVLGSKSAKFKHMYNDFKVFHKKNKSFVWTNNR